MRHAQNSPKPPTHILIHSQFGFLCVSVGFSAHIPPEVFARPYLPFHMCALRSGVRTLSLSLSLFSLSPCVNFLFRKKMNLRIHLRMCT